MLKKRYRLKKNRDFQAVYGKKNSAASGGVVLYVTRRPDAVLPRVGFSVSKKVGKAVIRNRCRRLMREAVRLHVEEIAPGRDYVFVARRSLAGADFLQTEHDVLSVLKRKRCLAEQDG